MFCLVDSGISILTLNVLPEPDAFVKTVVSEVPSITPSVFPKIIFAVSKFGDAIC